MRPLFTRLLAALVLAQLCAAAPAAAQPVDPRRAVQQGQALPLGKVLQQVLPRYPGQLLRADLVRDPGGATVYQLRILDASGKVFDITADARTGQVLSARGTEPPRR